MSNKGRCRVGLFLTLSIPAGWHTEAQNMIELEEVVVTGRAQDLTGIAESASQGRVGQVELALRPTLRTAEVLEVIPGLLATQHSGTGKANQYFLRGFNLDHGTDFATHVDGVPLNLPTHGHGQGYLDLNSIIPELIEGIEFGKGPYSAEVGDFASAGHARIHTLDRLAQGFVKLGVGEDDYYRLVAANSSALGPGELLYALETQVYEGPWKTPEDLEKYNGLVKYTQGDPARGLAIVGSVYSSQWTATDQIPRRAVESDLISRLGTIDPSDGGESSRASLSFEHWDNREDTATRLGAYAVYADLELFSNFTFVLDDLVNGDQIFQKDRRLVVGGEASRAWFQDLAGYSMTNRLGVSVRHDDIPKVGLFKTRERAVLSTVRDDDVRETSLALYAKNETQWRDKLRTVLGLRGDLFFFDVKSRLAENSGDTSDEILSPSFGLILGPWQDTEYYFNAGLGFHSNDARGTTTRIDPVTGETVSPVDPLARTRGAELGLRTTALAGLQSTVALWYLELDSELVFVGDAGTTEPRGESRRYGVEWANFYRLTDWLTLDADFAFTESRFVDEPAGEEVAEAPGGAPGSGEEPSVDEPATGKAVPGSVGRVITAGMTIDLPSGYFGSLRLRHFGDVPLIEDTSVKADATTLFNLAVGYQRPRWQAALDILNLFDSSDPDISYFYASQLPGEAAEGVEDIHFHPVEPRTVRAYVTYRF